MNGLSDQGFAGESSNQNVESNDSIDLGDHQRWSDPTPWELGQQEEQQRRESDLQVQHWLIQQPNSQPSQDTFITSQSLPQRKLDTHKVIDYVNDVFGNNTRPSAAQSSGAPSTTVPRIRHPTSSNVTSIDERLLQKSRPSAPSFLPFAATSDRKIRYTDNGNHDEGRPPGMLASQDRSSVSTALSGPYTRGAYKQPIDPSLQQKARSLAGTDISSSSKKLPKRQNSRSADDEATGKHQLAKRYRPGNNIQSLHHASPESPGSSRLAQPGMNLPLQDLIGGSQGSQRRTRNLPLSSISDGPSSSNSRRDGPVRNRACELVSPDDFKNACETCFFWLYDPKRFSTTDRQACSGRKDEISHIITHAADHHGLIRGKDPNHSSRKYLARFHYMNGGAEILLTRNTMVMSFACGVGAGSPKEKKVCILYTTFCSVTEKPSGPPQNMAPRKSNPRHTGNRSNGTSSRQQTNSQSTRNPAPKKTSRDPRPISSKAPNGQGKQKPPVPSFSSPTQNRPLIEKPAPTSQQTTRRPHNQQSTPDESPSLSKPIESNPPNQQPIAYMPIYPHTSPQYVAGMVKNMQRNGSQEVPQSLYPSIGQQTSFGNRQGRSASYGFQQHTAQPHAQDMLPPNQCQNWQSSLRQQSSHAFPQTPSRNQGQSQQQSHQNGEITRFPQRAYTQTGLSQQSFGPFPMHETTSGEGQQPHMQLPTSINSPVLNGGDRQLYQACVDAADAPFTQYLAMPVNDADAAVSLSDIRSQVQSSASRVPSTAGESMGLLQSPNIKEPMWLDMLELDEPDSLLNFGYIGYNPELQATVEPHQPEEVSKPNSRLSAARQNDLEKDSAYHSQPPGAFDEPDININDMFT
ncbi:hypothetical protein F53441_3308 [Fusarium austroafricanum]|uniref:Uncharacterized protein n=1 Tax=Fusarium austroafricanum TaxID=2364996 RepID=A0A8H4KPR8_9HYPO|nr:hypothetical protein F53441_3308 [Fusarium austroafricanum]